MSENTIISINNVKLYKDMTTDYEKGDPLINSVFKKFDTNNDKKIDDTEWAKVVEYNEKVQKRQQQITKLNKNSKTISHYDKKIIKLQKKLDTLQKQYDEVPRDFDKVIEFEKKHPGVRREGVLDKSEIPPDCTQYDISLFEMGIYDEKKEVFTGECYKLGYLKGLETLTPEEQKEYLELLDNSSKNISKIVSIGEKIQKVDDEIDKNLALKDLAQNGLIEKVGSAEYENQMYTQYTNIRNQANPFLTQMNEYEQKFHSLLLKGKRTAEEDRQLEQYSKQMSILQEASKKWSIADIPEDEKLQVEQGLKITDFSEQITYNNDGQNEKYTDTHSVGVQYNNANFNIQGNFQQTQIYKHNEDTENTFIANISGQYSKGNYSVSSNTSFNTDKFYLNLDQTFGAKYKNLGIDYTKTLMSTKQDEETVTSTSDRIGVSYTAGKFNNNASITWAPEGTTYAIGSNTSFQKQLTNNLNLNIMPSANMSYNNQNKTYTLNPSLTTAVNYSNNRLNANLMLVEDYTSTLSKYTKPQNTNMFMASGGVSFKGFGTNLKFTDIDSSFNHSDTYGAEIYYDKPNFGRLAVEYNYQKITMKMPDISPMETSTLIAKYTLPLDVINGWFK